MDSRTKGQDTPSSPAAEKRVAFAALKHKDYRWFLAATMLAMVADNIEHVLSYWVLFQKFQSPALAGFAVISHWTPFLLLSVYFGGLADRYDCRKLIQVAQVMYKAVTAAWAVLFFTNNVEVDDRGYIYIADRANTGMHILELSGSARSIANWEVAME